VVDDNYERVDYNPGTPLPPRKRVRTRATTPESPTFIPLGLLSNVSAINGEDVNVSYIEAKPVYELLDNVMELSSG
jgi:hypothetical protein